jgi:hypothetical protein
VPRSAWGHAIFADDLRLEVGGKISIMGLYQIDMLFPTEFPITLAKLAIFVRYFEERDAFKEDLTLTVRVPGSDEPLLTSTIRRQEISVPSYPYKDMVPDDERDLQLSIEMPIVISPVIIPKEGFMTVQMRVGETTTRLGRLMMRKARPEELVNFSGLTSTGH